MDPVVAFVGLYRVIGSLFVLRWPFWGALVAVVCDLCDLLLFNLFVVFGGWSGFAGYQTFDKWADQVYLATFLIVALRDFAPLPKRIAVALYLFRFVGFVAFETGVAPREALFLFPNLFEFWFIAVAFTMRFRPAFSWTTARSAGVLAVLLAGKLVQEWVLHVGRAMAACTGGLGTSVPPDLADPLRPPGPCSRSAFHLSAAANTRTRGACAASRPPPLSARRAFRSSDGGSPIRF